MFSITSSVDELPAETEIVVVGSGYGGAVAASRMARAGREVCLLERGEEWLPGEFPDTEEEAAGEIQLDLPEEHEGPATGLYDFHVNPEISVLVGCGLGGTSLINANVVIEPTDEIFANDEWPTALQNPQTGEFPLRRGFDRTRQMLEPRPYPDDPDQPDLPKLEALRESAEHLDVPLERPDIAVTFDDRVNAAGVEQQACTLCGDCVSGCNYGSKNTLLMNYLPDAWNHGAEIFTGTEVRYLEREGDQWRAYYRTHGDGRAAFDAPPSAVAADAVFLAAGSLGSTEILKRSERRGGLDVSDRLGEGFSGNGDALGFAYNTDREVRSIGHG
ncbi:MAG: GMC family oxidoreductase N-terminal domain-containing protein, partial [Bradymonadaceae bacterium]